VNDDIVKITKQLIDHFAPMKIILFGSQAKGTATARSDIDLCIVAEADDKRGLLTEMYCTIDVDKPYDLLLYTPNEWDACVGDKGSFVPIS